MKKILEKCNSQNYPFVALVVFLMGFMLYGSFLHNPMIFDDIYFFSNAKESDFFTPEAWQKLRWLPLVSFFWVKNWLSPDLIWLHLVNDAIHFFNAFLLYAILKQLFESVLIQDNSLTARKKYGQFALFGALFFLLHPVSVYAVTYIVQRTMLVMTFFALLSMYAFLQAMRTKQYRWLVGTVIAYALSIHAKENSIMLPVGFILLALLLERPNKSLLSFLTPAFCVMGLFALHIVSLVASKQLIGQAYELSANDYFSRLKELDPHFNVALSYPLSVLTQAYLYFKYLLIWVVPGPDWLAIDIYEPFETKMMSLKNVVSLLAVSAYIGAAIWYFKQRGLRGLFGFGLLWPLVMYITEFSTVRIQETFVVYRSYFWIVGLFACVPYLFQKLTSERWIKFVTVFFAVVLFLLAWVRLETFTAPLYVWNDAARLLSDEEKRPGTERIYFARGGGLF